MVKTSQIPAHFSHPMDIPASLWFHENLSYPKTSTYATATSFYSRCDCTIRQASLPNNVACTFHSSKKLKQSCRLRATSVVQLVVMLMTQAVCLAGWDYRVNCWCLPSQCVYTGTPGSHETNHDNMYNATGATSSNNISTHIQRWRFPVDLQTSPVQSTSALYHQRSTAHTHKTTPLQ